MEPLAKPAPHPLAVVYPTSGEACQCPPQSGTVDASPLNGAAYREGSLAQQVSHSQQASPRRIDDLLASQGLPANLDAERGLLGAILLNNVLLDEVGPTLRDDDFALPAHQRIFRGLVELRQKQQAMDLVTLTNTLQNRGELEAIGGAGKLAELIEGVPILDSAEHYTRIIRDKAILRRLIQQASSIISNAYASSGDAESVLAQAEQAILDVGERVVTRSLVSLKDFAHEAMETLLLLSKDGKHVTGVSTGFGALDELTSGLQRSDLIIIAARPSVGKTAFALSLALNAARQDRSIALFSLEMSAEQLFFRLLSMDSHVPLKAIRTGQIPKSQQQEVSKTFVRLERLPVYLDDSPLLSLLEMGAKLRRLKVSKGLDMVIVDYLQLMRGTGKFENRNQEVSSISRGLKALAKELAVPVVALSQLSRAPEKRGEGKEPILSDLRDSGSIEQDADLVMFLHRSTNPRAEESESRGRAKLIVAKQRNGPTNTVTLTFLEHEVQFANYTPGFGEGEADG